jgi:peptide/nickel transport system substrate-binding protein
VEKALILLKEDLDTIGVKMNIKAVEFATLQQINLEHRFEASAAGWGTGADPDTANNLWKTESYTNGRNWVGYSNPEVDKLYDEGAKEFDPEKRKAIYQRIDRLIWDDQPYTWVYYQRSLFAFSKRLRGYDFSPRDPFSYHPGFMSVWVPKAQ